MPTTLNQPHGIMKYAPKLICKTEGSLGGGKGDMVAGHEGLWKRVLRTRRGESYCIFSLLLLSTPNVKR